MVNPQDVIDIALGMNMWVFGGYLRDHVIRGQPFQDLDICCPRGTYVRHFFRTLSTRWSVRRAHEYVPGRYGCMSKGLKGVYKCVVDNHLHVDVVVFDGTLDDWREEHSTDFTSNLFYMSRETELGLRYVPLMFRHEANPVRHIKNLTRQGIFFRIWNGDDHTHVWAIVRRARELVERGFTFRGVLLSEIMNLGLLGYPHMRLLCIHASTDMNALQTVRVKNEMDKCDTVPSEFKTKIYSYLDAPQEIP